MQCKFGLFLCLLVALHVASTTSIQRPRMLTTDYVTRSGNVTINKDYYGYYVNADLYYNYYDASDSEADDNYLAKMSLGLYTSQTLFNGYDCLDFNEYSCGSYGCSEYTSQPKTPTYLDFTVSTGYAATASLYLDYSYWQLRSSAVIASYCNDNTYSYYGGARYGIIGLGVNGTASNFNNNPTMFSISLARDGSTGTLLFWSNSEMATSDNYVGQLSSTEDWQIAPTYVTIDVGYYTLSTYIGLIFDLNPNGIGLPINIFDDIIDYIEDSVSITCSDSYSQPTCYYYGIINDLPTITINIQGVDISLPPTLYVQDESDGDAYVYDITLNFRIIDPSYSGYNYVSAAYENYIILDASFMSYYYTEFSYNYGSPSITFYTQYSDANPSPHHSNQSWPYIVGGVLGFVIIVSLICCCIKQRKVRLQQQANRNLFTPSDQAALVTNVVVTAPYPGQAQTYPPQNYAQYDQGGYGYGYYQQAPNQAYANANAQPNYVPPQQGQYYGN